MNESYIKGKSVVVTGAGGSIGSVLCDGIVRNGAKALKLISLTEGGLYDVERKLRAIKSDTEIIGILGSVRDLGMMRDACDGADIVIHAAAHKHVPICENNPIAAIENNIHGTINAALAAERAGVDQFLFVSTDKAVHPASIMGATKRVAEMVIGDKAWRSRSKGTIFTTVRFGNVLDSAGSVLPLWGEQLAAGGPITLTDKRCERYFMSIPQACELIFGVLKMQKPGTFVFDMGKPQKMVDLAAQLIGESGSECAITLTGLRPGEKLTEELHHGGELVGTSHPKIFEVSSNGKSVEMVKMDDLLCAATCRKTKMAVDLLREMVR